MIWLNENITAQPRVYSMTNLFLSFFCAFLNDRLFIVVTIVMHFTFIAKIEVGKFLDKNILEFCDICIMRSH